MKFFNYFTKTDVILWSCSIFVVLCSFFVFDRNNYLTLCASLIGVTSLIFNAKGYPFGQVLMIIFSIIYGIISYSFSYYGEMITYLGMTLPMAVFALISWLRNPFLKGKAEVKVNTVCINEYIFLFVLSSLVTIIFYFILKSTNTANLFPSTLSVTTSFIAAYLTFRRSPYFALAYAANDIVLIVLWILATISSLSYLSVVICFSIFFVNDLYGFFSWHKMLKRQKNKSLA